MKTMSTPSMRLAEIPNSRGWSVVAVDPVDRWAASDLERNLHAAGFSTASVEIDPRLSAGDAARILRSASSLLRTEVGPEVVVHFSGVGRGAPAAMHAARGLSAGSLLWRPVWRPSTPVPAVSAPSMVVVHLDEGRRARRAGRRLVHRMGDEGRLAVLWSDTDPEGVVAEWSHAVLRGAWAAPATSRPVRPMIRRLALPGAVAIGAGTMMLPGVAGASPYLPAAGHVVTSLQRAGDGAASVSTPANQTGKKSRFQGSRVGSGQRAGDSVHIAATGSGGLIDNAGMEWFVNTDITFSATSSASGAMSEASFQGPVAASTLNGGTTASTLNDAYDGYNSLCISTNGTQGTCETGNSNWNIYNQTGASPTTDCNGREYVFPVQAVGSLDVSRKVYVPSDDHFARWLDIFTNTGSTAQTFTVATANNLGSDSNTVITGTSSGSATPSVSDQWVTTFQNWTGTNTTSSDPRLGHVIEGPNATVQPSTVHFVAGDDNPFWDYNVTVAPGQTAEILNFGVADATIAGSKADSARLDALPSSALECVTSQEKAEIVNFNAVPPPPPPPPPPPVLHPAEAGATTSTPDGKGYWVVTPSGIVKAYGDAQRYGDLTGTKLAAPIVGIVATPDGKGYWLVGADGGVFTFGDAHFLGSAADFHLAAPVSGIAATADGKGYWLVGADGGVFTFGDAHFLGSAADFHLAAPVSGIAATADGKGYWLVGADGGVFTFGDAHFHGSAAGHKLAAPMVDIAPTANGSGYSLAGADGGVFVYGHASYHGSISNLKLAAPIVGLAHSADGGGYWLVGGDGGVFSLGDAGFYGNTAGSRTNATTIGAVAALDGKGYRLVRSDGSSTTFGH
jgi:hypothetical protein